MYTIVYGMSRVVPARLPAELAKGIDRLVRTGRFANRSEVIKEAARLLITSGDSVSQSSKARASSRLASLMIAWNMPVVETMILYGSVARGEAGSQSDIDILVIIGEGEPWKARRSMYELIYPVMVSFGVDISLMVVTREDWKKMLEQHDPFAVSVMKEGRPLWGSLVRLA